MNRSGITATDTSRHANGRSFQLPEPAARSGRLAGVSAPSAAQIAPLGVSGGWRRWYLGVDLYPLRSAADTSWWRSRRTDNRRRHRHQLTQSASHDRTAASPVSSWTEQRCTAAMLNRVVPRSTLAIVKPAPPSSSSRAFNSLTGSALRVLAEQRPADRPWPRRRGAPADRLGAQDDDGGHGVAEPSVENDGVGHRLTGSGRHREVATLLELQHRLPTEAVAEALEHRRLPGRGDGQADRPGPFRSRRLAIGPDGCGGNPAALTSHIVGGDESIAGQRAPPGERTDGDGPAPTEGDDRPATRQRGRPAHRLYRQLAATDRQVAHLRIVDDRGHGVDDREAWSRTRVSPSQTAIPKVRSRWYASWTAARDDGAMSSTFSFGAHIKPGPPRRARHLIPR